MSARSSVRARCFAASLLAVLAVPSVAFAEEPLPPLAGPAAPTTAPTAPTTAPPAEAVTPAPGQAAAAAPSSAPVAITATCSLGDHFGIDDVEARTGADLVCNELAKDGATNTSHEVRFGKLGGKVLVTVASRRGNGYDERRTLLTGMDELPVAAPRLAAAMTSGQSLAETKSVDNVLDSEARRAKVEQGQIGFDMGVFGTTGIGRASGASGGVFLGLVYRAGSVAVTSHGRAGGISSDRDAIGSATLDVGGRYYLSRGETAPFVGGGLGLAYFDFGGRDASGVEAFGEIGLEALRTQHVAFSLSARLDAPFFEGRGYIAPASLNVAMLFH